MKLLKKVLKLTVIAFGVSIGWHLGLLILQYLLALGLL